MTDENDGFGFFRSRKKKDRSDSTSSSSSEEGGKRVPDVFDGPAPIVKAPIVTRPPDSNRYSSDHANVGVALIFNHEYIQGESRRVGTNRDRDRIRKLLLQCSFDVRTHDDATFEEIYDILDKTSKEDHSQNDCLCVVVMSHGLPGKVYAKDMAYPVERLWDPFLGIRCPSLINKPKLFFIQACRGEKFDSGAQYRGFTTMSRSLDIPDANAKVMYTIPSTADLLVMYSTFEGNYSWRNPSNGSWFIQSLCDELETLTKTREMELFQFLVSVSRRVAYEYQSNVPDNENADEKKEMPQFVSTLTKMFYLKIREL